MIEKIEYQLKVAVDGTESTKIKDKFSEIKSGIESDIDAGQELTDRECLIRVVEGLKGLESEDEKLAICLGMWDNHHALLDLGIGSDLTTLKQTKTYENNSEAKYFVDYFTEAKQSGIADYKILESFKANVQNFSWDEVFKSSIDRVQSEEEKYKSHILVQSALDSLEVNPNVGLLETAVYRLEVALSLPADQVPQYVRLNLSEFKHMDDCICDLICKLDLLDKSKLSKTSNHNNNISYTGQAKVTEFYSPITQIGENKIIILGKKLASLNPNGDMKLLGIDELSSVDKDFLLLGEAFIDTEIEDGKLGFNDGEHEYAVYKDIDDKIKIDIDGAVFEYDSEDLDDELAAMNISHESMAKVKTLAHGYDEIDHIEEVKNLQQLDGKNFELFVVGNNKKHHLVTLDYVQEMATVDSDVSMDELMTAIAKIFHFDASHLFEEESAEEREAKEEAFKEIEEIEKEIEEIENAIETIDQEDEETKSDDAVVEARENLHTELERLKAKLPDLKNIVEGKVEKGTITKVIKLAKGATHTTLDELDADLNRQYGDELDEIDPNFDDELSIAITGDAKLVNKIVASYEGRSIKESYVGDPWLIINFTMDDTYDAQMIAYADMGKKKISYAFHDAKSGKETGDHPSVYELDNLPTSLKGGLDKAKQQIEKEFDGSLVVTKWEIEGDNSNMISESISAADFRDLDAKAQAKELNKCLKKAKVDAKIKPTSKGGVFAVEGDLDAAKDCIYDGFDFDVDLVQAQSTKESISDEDFMALDKKKQNRELKKGLKQAKMDMPSLLKGFIEQKEEYSDVTIVKYDLFEDEYYVKFTDPGWKNTTLAHLYQISDLYFYLKNTLGL